MIMVKSAAMEDPIALKMVGKRNTVMVVNMVANIMTKMITAIKMVGARAVKDRIMERPRSTTVAMVAATVDMGTMMMVMVVTVINITQEVDMVDTMMMMMAMEEDMVDMEATAAGDTMMMVMGVTAINTVLMEVTVDMMITTVGKVATMMMVMEAMDTMMMRMRGMVMKDVKDTDTMRMMAMDTTMEDMKEDMAGIMMIIEVIIVSIIPHQKIMMDIAGKTIVKTK